MFSEIIKNLRTKSKMSFKALSEATKIPSRTLQDWEYGKRTPPEWQQQIFIEYIQKKAHLL